LTTEKKEKKEKKNNVNNCSVYGDVLTYIRILSAKKLRNSEETPGGRLTHIIPGLGMFHFVWEVMKLIFQTWWGHQEKAGCLSWLKVALGAHSVSIDAKKFAYCDTFLFEAARVKVMEAFFRCTSKKLATVEDADVETVLAFIFKIHSDKDKEDLHLASFLQASLLYIEVRGK